MKSKNKNLHKKVSTMMKQPDFSYQNPRSQFFFQIWFVVVVVLQLFDHIADCINRFIHDHSLKNEKLPLGFTFSFPCKQEGLAKARLSKWTKGFRCEGVVNEDICFLLHEAMKRKNVSSIVTLQKEMNMKQSLVLVQLLCHLCHLSFWSEDIQVNVF